MRGEGARRADEVRCLISGASLDTAPHPAFGHPLPALAGRGGTKSKSPRDLISLPFYPLMRGEGARRADEGRCLISGASLDTAPPRLSATLSPLSRGEGRQNQNHRET